MLEADHSAQPTQFSHLNQQQNPVHQPLQQFQPIQESQHITQNPQQSQSSQELQHILEPHEQIISHYMEPQSYLTLPIPTTISFPGIQPIPSSSDIGIMITPNQGQMQEQVG